MLNKEKLLELFEYKDGILYRKKATANCTKIGEKAGFITKNGYYKVKINEKSYFAHRLIFLMHHGYLPKIVDHVDNSPSNNLIANLRDATKAQNNSNAKLRIDSTSGFKGVTWHKNSWEVRVQANGKRKHIGSFKDLELAELVATMAREKYHGLFARHH